MVITDHTISRPSLRSAAFVPSETEAIRRFQTEHRDLFQKDDRLLLKHLAIVLVLIVLLSALSIASGLWGVRLFCAFPLALLYFSLINVTLHHHQTHRNAAQSRWANQFLEALFLIVLPQARQRRNRYVKVHLSHHAGVYETTDVDHLYGAERFFRMRGFWARVLYYLELTFIGAHVPGWVEDRYMNETPRDLWNLRDYKEVKRKEKISTWGLAVFYWSGFAVLLALLPWFAWVWVLPMLLVNNWAHFLGQFQHYDERLLNPVLSRWKRTRSYRVPGWLNYLLAGEIRGHFLHHMFPALPYYRIEEACQRFLRRPDLVQLFLID